jgi:thioredoxin 1
MNVRRGTILGVIIAVIVIGSGIVLFAQSEQPGQTAGQASVELINNQTTAQASVEPTKNQATARASVEPTKNPPTQQPTHEPTIQEALAQRYIPYSSDALAKAQGRTVIFFMASWCQSCRAADQDFKAHFDKVPSDVTILRADYDTETALKQKYNVTSQDTFVQVDKHGNSVTQWNSGGQGVNALLNNIK